MSLPWEEKNLTLSKYVEFMDTHVRLRVRVNGELKGSFSVLDTGINLEVTLTSKSGKFVITSELFGQPRTVDPMVTPEELAKWVIENFP